jgi:hypothetical protein
MSTLVLIVSALLNIGATAWVCRLLLARHERDWRINRRLEQSNRRAVQAH